MTNKRLINWSLARLENIVYLKVFDFYKKFNNLFMAIKQLIANDMIYSTNSGFVFLIINLFVD